MDYKNGKIYKLWCVESDLIYIGSTCSPLYKRLYQHKLKTNNISSKKLFELSNNVKIELILNFPCNNINELNKKEGEIIRLNKEKCVNKIIAGRTNEEYYNDNKSKIREQQKQYDKDNKDKIKEQKKNYYEVNKEKLLEHQKEYNNNNKELKKEYDKQYYKAKKELKKEYYKQYYKAKKELKNNIIK